MMFKGSYPSSISETAADFIIIFIVHYNDVIMSAIAFQITSPTILYSTIYSGADQRKHQSSASLAFVWGIHRWPVNSPHKGPVTRKRFPFDDIIMSFYLNSHRDNGWVRRQQKHDVNWLNQPIEYPRKAKFIGPTWGPPGSCRPQMGPMLAPWTLLSGSVSQIYRIR